MKLSPRETEIIQLICQGYTDVKIAQKIKISPRTVQTHVTRILIKFNANTRAHAVAKYIGTIGCFA